MSDFLRHSSEQRFSSSSDRDVHAALTGTVTEADFVFQTVYCVLVNLKSS